MELSYPLDEEVSAGAEMFLAQVFGIFLTYSMLSMLNQFESGLFLSLYTLLFVCVLFFACNVYFLRKAECVRMKYGELEERYRMKSLPPAEETPLT